jgi:hypothetical protein
MPVSMTTACAIVAAISLPLAACASPDARTPFAEGWRPAHVVQVLDRSALPSLAQTECGQAVASLPAAHQQFAVVSYHPQTNPKLKARRVVPLLAGQPGALGVGDHVMVRPADCLQPLVASP